MQHVPREVMYAASELPISRNTFRLETSGATSAGSASIVTITLPESASGLDLRSFKVFMDFQTTSTAVNGKTVYGKLGRVEDLISNFEVFIGGISICNISDYNSVCRLFKLANANNNRESTIGGVSSGGTISETDEDEDLSLCFIPPIGFFAESAVRYISSNITGSITCRITFAPPSVLALKEDGVGMANNFADADSRASAALVTYRVTNIHATIDTISMGETFDKMLVERLSGEDFLPVNYLDYTTFNQFGQTGDHVTRFSIASDSVESVLSGMRQSNYTTVGIRSREFAEATTTEPHCPNAFYFESFNGTSLKKSNNLRFSYTCNSIKHPQFDASVLDAATTLAQLSDKVGNHSVGNMVSSLAHFQGGAAAFPLILNLPGQPLHVRSGYSTKGSNTSLELQFKNITPKTAAAAPQDVATISTFVAVQTKKQLRIAAHRSIAVDH